MYAPYAFEHKKSMHAHTHTRTLFARTFGIYLYKTHNNNSIRCSTPNYYCYIYMIYIVESRRTSKC